MTEQINSERTNMDKHQWIERCADRYVDVTGIDRARALEFAGACADQEIEVNGPSMKDWSLPEVAADDDMSYWDDDGEDHGEGHG